MLTATDFEVAVRNWPSVSGAVSVPHDEPAYHRLVELLDRLADQVGEDEDHPLASLMEVVGILIEKYENEHIPELEEEGK